MYVQALVIYQLLEHNSTHSRRYPLPYELPSSYVQVHMYSLLYSQAMSSSPRAFYLAGCMEEVLILSTVVVRA